MGFQSNGRRFPLRLSIAALLAAIVAGDVGAQSIDCAQLRAQILSLGHRRHGTSYERAARKQQGEIERTAAYAHSLGCDQGQFLFFGGGNSPQCPGINARLSQMNANLQALQNAANQGNAEDLRRDLTDRYNTYCGAGARQASAAPPQRGLFDFLFNHEEGPVAEPNPPDMPPDPSDQPEEPRRRSGGGKAVCVRLCDGGFFPVSYSARGDGEQDLADLCRALCPNTATAVYTYSIYSEIGSAVAADGSSYSDLPTAFQYSKSYDSACTCRPPGRTWVQTLADAEDMLAKHKSDVIVTPEKSAELSRPVNASVVKGKPGTYKVQKPAPPPVIDDPSAAEGAIGAQVPTASKDSAGINVGNDTGASVYGENQGEFHELIGPDGVKRRVRVVAPTL